MTRPRIPITKPVDLEAFDAELGGHGLCASASEIVTAEGSPVTQQQLEDGYAAHVIPPPPPEVVNEETLRQRAEEALAANGAFLAKATPTNAEILAHVRLLTRESSALIRLALGRFETVD